MLDARLDDLLCRIDMITYRLAAHNCGQGESLSVQEETALLRELQHLNVRLATRFAASRPRVLVASSAAKALGTICAGLVLALMIGLVVMIVGSFVDDLAMSLIQVARPVP